MDQPVFRPALGFGYVLPVRTFAAAPSRPCGDAGANPPRGVAVCLLLGLLAEMVVLLARAQPWWSHLLVFAATVTLPVGVLAVHGVPAEYLEHFASSLPGEDQPGDPLSDHEHRQLERMEQALYAGHPGRSPGGAVQQSEDSLPAQVR
jgi:hypothetical protein